MYCKVIYSSVAFVEENSGLYFNHLTSSQYNSSDSPNRFRKLKFRNIVFL